MFETLHIRSASAPETRNIGVSLAKSLYCTPLTLFVSGDLGAGKTLFAQGLAQGMGITEPVVSPTYALEQRYGDTLTHLDLYRLNRTQAVEFLAASEDAPGIRLIEWAQRLTPPDDGMPYIRLEIREHSATERELQFRLHDVPLPTVTQIREWQEAVGLPEHIRAHTAAVAKVAGLCADDLLKRGIFIRKKAVVAAARLHDLLRFTDFKSLTGDAHYSPTPAQTATWTRLKAEYGQPHEQAAQRYVTAMGYPQLGTIIRTHGLHGLQDASYMASSIEQQVLAYSDKRVRFDTQVSIDARFDDFRDRYGAGKESESGKAWRRHFLALEKQLFPEGAPL